MASFLAKYVRLNDWRWETCCNCMGFLRQQHALASTSGESGGCVETLLLLERADIFVGFDILSRYHFLGRFDGLMGLIAPI